MADRNALTDAIKAAEQAFLEALQHNRIYGVRNGAKWIAQWPQCPCEILFLDFDGVLNSEHSARELGCRYTFGKASVAALNFILQNSSALIVVSSTWRDQWALQEVAQFLERDGVIPGRVVGKTPSLGAERGMEIDAWLKSAPYKVRSYVILDDRDDMTIHRGRLIQVDARFGLNIEQARQALEILAKPLSSL